MSAALVVLRKELLSGLRDKRALLSLLLFPLVGPVLISFILTSAIEQQTAAPELALPVAGSRYAPGLVHFLQSHDIAVVEAPADVVSAVRRRRIPMALVIAEDYGERFRQGRQATVELVVDQSRTETQAAISHINSLVTAHGRTVGALRLLARGVDPDLAEPIVVTKVDLSTPKQRAALILNLIPMFVLLATFIGGMHTATDSTAGERERGSLEPLLTTPVLRRALVLGKWGAAVAMSALTSMVTLAATLVALGRVPVGRLGISLTLSAPEVAGVLLAVLPLCLLVTAAQMLVASFARSVKEAQTYLSLMVFVPMLPAMAASVQPFGTKLWMLLVPVLGQQALLMDLIRGQLVGAERFALAGGAATLAALLCVRATAALFRRERIIYGR